ncbi:uncharacterized protein N7473_004328 [Penicillium subrubescens]|uniref:uncharacterized protein n=1 Tax=Penicillium subrubescens TaxID=1316194 RepID=UPI002544ED1B|nr:uncharacterized protein N7473_004328 [Penicillium subrubescens]KAJ5900258.1 hypothetical protein N7473_004328 [Penicillium subrubescens]
MRPTPTTTPPPQSRQPTYAGVLRHRMKTSLQWIPKTRETVSSTECIPTIELEPKRRKHSPIRICNTPVSATKSLSKFLTSALPAFSRILL